MKIVLLLGSFSAENSVIIKYNIWVMAHIFCTCENIHKFLVLIKSKDFQIKLKLYVSRK